jgi:hypothetical protein
MHLSIIDDHANIACGRTVRGPFSIFSMMPLRMLGMNLFVDDTAYDAIEEFKYTAVCS